MYFKRKVRFYFLISPYLIVLMLIFCLSVGLHNCLLIYNFRVNHYCARCNTCHLSSPQSRVPALFFQTEWIPLSSCSVYIHASVDVFTRTFPFPPVIPNCNNLIHPWSTIFYFPLITLISFIFRSARWFFPASSILKGPHRHLPHPDEPTVKVGETIPLTSFSV
jgi:hypothetical protein